MTTEFNTQSPSHPISRIAGPIRLLTAACALLVFAAAAPVTLAQTPTMIVLRAAPAKTKKTENSGPMAPLVQADIAEIKIGGKVAPIVSFTPVLKGPHTLQLMVLLDSEQMLGANGQFDDLKKFFTQMPSNVEIGVGWLLQGKVKVTQPFTTDRDLAGKALVAKTREEAAAPKNDNGNPFACLRDLAAHWPNADPAKLRAVLFFTDGIIRNNSSGSTSFGLTGADDQVVPDVDAAAQAFQRAGIVPYPFFYMDAVPADPSRSEGGSLEGQQSFAELDAPTGGAGLFEGMFAPGSLRPLLDRLYSILESEVVVTVNAQGGPGKLQPLDLKSARDDIRLVGPDSVMTGNVLKK
jgi:hypothetical protein